MAGSGGNTIEVEALSKRYRLGASQGDLRETLQASLERLRRRRPPERGEFWALRDISFTTGEGEAVGLIGRNGAGKSTLLKVLGRITEPTKGESRTRGRVGTLLEIGTGFHPELTGRENIYLNGSILGMRRRDVDRRLDEITEFAGIEKFLDTPVKRFSSGMYLRLAFAVMAHLDSEILVVDEVLAVGDAEFQRRCLSRMSEVEAEGRTILFVSHDLNAVATLCDRAIWLDQGSIVEDGPTQQTIDKYLASGLTRASDTESWSIPGSGVILEEFEVETAPSRGPTHDREQPLGFRFRFRVEREVNPFRASISIHDLRNRPVIEEFLPLPTRLPAGCYDGRMTLPPLLNVGQHSASMGIGSNLETYAFAEHALHFDVIGEEQGWGNWGDPRPAVRVQPEWDIHPQPPRH